MKFEITCNRSGRYVKVLADGVDITAGVLRVNYDIAPENEWRPRLFIEFNPKYIRFEGSDLILLGLDEPKAILQVKPPDLPLEDKGG